MELSSLWLNRTCFGKPRGKYKKALHAFNHLKEAIANAPDIEPIFKEAEKVGLTEEEAVLEILWMLKWVWRICISALTIIKSEQKEKRKPIRW